ncbi:hypothetical protein [Bosea sp. Root381]|uniref:P-loop ATPase, Sll1717 family n=1 Tax=Bosea sp. Root381 TaxID=1736524 RepID=UPI000AC764B2|nr:hypothetical protein [Bosea sp. Root381]
MNSFVSRLGLVGNPFEHYTAETEPHIADYAIRPPYLQAISERAHGLSTFILFGDRGAGKSATRITVFNEIWKVYVDNKDSKRLPFVVNLTDYSRIEAQFKKGRLTDRDIVSLVGYCVVEQVLVWLSSLTPEDREVFTEGLDDSERTLILALLKGFYLSVNEADRELSTAEALRILDSAWTTKGRVWASQRWAAAAKVVAAVVSSLSKRQLGIDVDITAPAEALLKSLVGDSPNAPRAILSKLVEFVGAFGFTGVVVLVDKIDEIQSTANSSEATASLIHPLLAQIQLLEVANFSFIFFLWVKVKDHFEAKHPVRLDKIAHATISWKVQSLREMIDARIRFFSERKLEFKDFLANDLDTEATFSEICKISLNSPRELIKLLDTIIREHDARGDDASDLIDRASLDAGLDKYSVETIGKWFNPKYLQQVLRLGQVNFVNSDVQFAFKIGGQGARNKIKVWQDAGLVIQSGTSQSEAGGKPVYRFTVADARVVRIIERNLVESVGAQLKELFAEWDITDLDLPDDFLEVDEEERTH